ncbi:MAG: hypothetical protein V9E83_06895 [Baekduia sp.]
MTNIGIEVAPVEPDGLPRRPGPRLGALAAAFVTAGLYAACVAVVYEAMRWVMVNQGGVCASGGPYEISPGQTCDGTAVAMLFGGVFAGLVAGGLVLVAARRTGGPNASAAAIGLLWAGLFGALGWNFIDLGFDPPTGDSSAGWLIPGFTFWLMAAPGLLPVLWLRRKVVEEPSRSPAASIPIVRARLPGQAPVTAPRGTEPGAADGETAPAAPSGWPWLLATLAGAAGGAAAGSALAVSWL